MRKKEKKRGYLFIYFRSRPLRGSLPATVHTTSHRQSNTQRQEPAGTNQ